MGMNLERKRPPRWTAPVPETVCREMAWRCQYGSHVAIPSSTHSAFLDSQTVWAEYELLRCGCKFCETGNGQILVIQVWVVVHDFIGLE